MKSKCLILIFSLIVILIILIISCTFNGVSVQLVGRWKIEDLSMCVRLDEYVSKVSGELIINSDDTYYIDLKFKKPSGCKCNEAPFYIETTVEEYVHVKEHGTISSNYKYLFFEPADGGEWRAYVYYYWDTGIKLAISEFGEFPSLVLKKIN